MLNAQWVLTKFRFYLLDPSEQQIIINEINKELDACFDSGYSKYLSIGLVSRKLRVAKYFVLIEFDKRFKCVRKKNYSTRCFIERK